MDIINDRSKAIHFLKESFYPKKEDLKELANEINSHFRDITLKYETYDEKGKSVTFDSLKYISAVHKESNLEIKLQKDNGSFIDFVLDCDRKPLCYLYETTFFFSQSKDKKYPFSEKEKHQISKDASWVRESFKGKV
jgi:hypothetical protein